MGVELSSLFTAILSIFNVVAAQYPNKRQPSPERDPPPGFSMAGGKRSNNNNDDDSPRQNATCLNPNNMARRRGGRG